MDNNTVTIAKDTYEDLITDAAAGIEGDLTVNLGYLMRCKAVAEIVAAELSAEPGRSAFIYKKDIYPLLGICEEE